MYEILDITFLLLQLMGRFLNSVSITDVF